MTALHQDRITAGLYGVLLLRRRRRRVLHLLALLFDHFLADGTQTRDKLDTVERGLHLKKTERNELATLGYVTLGFVFPATGLTCG